MALREAPFLRQGRQGERVVRQPANHKAETADLTHSLRSGQEVALRLRSGQSRYEGKHLAHKFCDIACSQLPADHAQNSLRNWDADPANWGAAPTALAVSANFSQRFRAGLTSTAPTALAIQSLCFPSPSGLG